MSRPTNYTVLEDGVEGVVKMYLTQKGFGFITVEDHDDVFFHINDCIDDGLERGDRVKFDIVRDARRNRTFAKGVHLAV